jgi:Ca2+-binding RTX toxin-like protein
MKTSLLALTVLGLLGAFQAKSAQALTNLNNPFSGGPAVIVKVAKISGNMYVTWKRISDSSCLFQFIGGAAGLNTDYNVHGGGGNDNMQIVAIANQNVCGFTLEPLAYNGHYVDLFGEGGNDTVFNPGNNETWISGGPGKDLVFGSTFGGRIAGDDDEDLVLGGVDDNILVGGEGPDCLSVSHNLAATYDCGNGADRRTSTPSNVISCESLVPSCNFL